MSSTGILISSDLFFTSKVTSTARALGLIVRSVGTIAALSDAIHKESVGLMMLDLECRGISPSDVIQQLPTDSPIVTVAFGPHVRVELLNSARDAGFQQVWPRSKFSAELVELLRSTLNNS